MPNIRISKLTHDNLVELRVGMDSFDTVLRRLIAGYRVNEIEEEVKEHDRKAMEAKGAESSPSAWRETHKRAREVQP
ncbi:MAG: hypothetical protein MUP81_04525 [Dehalococcoidia bacterium]|nr:hypothetical protein [Dehalococcoidia bacterium]